MGKELIHLIQRLAGTIISLLQPMAGPEGFEVIDMDGPDGPGPGGDPMPWDPIPY